uniref:RNase III domain-containing protein n=1 Tax=Solanum lycopersicum TaxID=4081 RepID=K4AU10_SOLLC
MTTKKCLQNFHLESLEKLGKSFLRYAISIQLFKSDENYHEGLLNIKKNKIISNVAFFKLGCARKILRFIGDEPFYLKVWTIPCENPQVFNLKKFLDVPTSSWTGNVAALSFMKLIRMDIDFIYAPILRNFIVNAKNLVNVRYLEITATLQVSRIFAYAFKSSLHEHILHASPDLQRQICYTVENFEKLDIVSMFGW